MPVIACRLSCGFDARSAGSLRGKSRSSSKNSATAGRRRHVVLLPIHLQRARRVEQRRPAELVDGRLPTSARRPAAGEQRCEVLARRGCDASLTSSARRFEHATQASEVPGLAARQRSVGDAFEVDSGTLHARAKVDHVLGRTPGRAALHAPSDRTRSAPATSRAR